MGQVNWSTLAGLCADPENPALEQLQHSMIRLGGELNLLGDKAVEAAGYVHRLQFAGFHKGELAVVDGLADGVDHQPFCVLRFQRAQRVLHGLGYADGNLYVQAVTAEQIGAAVKHKPVRAGGGGMKRPFEFRDVDRHAGESCEMQRTGSNHAWLE